MVQCRILGFSVINLSWTLFFFHNMLRKVSGWVVRSQFGIIGCRCVFDVALVDVGIHRVL